MEVGLNILDLGCGSGWYAEQLLGKGVNVTAVDASAKMVALTKERLQNKGKFYVADLEKPLSFLNEKFDIVLAPLVIHYIKEWSVFFKEIATILKPEGLFIFSTHQPQTEVDLFNLDNYFTKTLITDNWPGIGEVKYYHHTLHELGDALYGANFVIERLLEPQPLAEFEKIDPAMYSKISRKPWLLFVKGRLRS